MSQSFVDKPNFLFLLKISQVPKIENGNFFPEFNYMIITSIHGDKVWLFPMKDRSQYFMPIKKFIGDATKDRYIYIPSSSVLYSKALQTKQEENCGIEFVP